MDNRRTKLKSFLVPNIIIPYQCGQTKQITPSSIHSQAYPRCHPGKLSSVVPLTSMRVDDQLAHLNKIIYPTDSSIKLDKK